MDPDKSSIGNSEPTNPTPPNSDSHKNYNPLYYETLHVIFEMMDLDDGMRKKIFEMLPPELDVVDETNDIPLQIPPADKPSFDTIINKLSQLTRNQKKVGRIVLVQAIVRGYLARKDVQRRQMIFNKDRNSAFLDLIREEVEYKKSLDLIEQIFIVPLRNTADKELRDQVQGLQGIFSAISDLIQVHRVFLRQLKGFAEMVEWPNIDGFGKIFLDNSLQFRAYGKYVENFKFAFDTVSQAESDPSHRQKFSKFLDDRVSNYGHDLKLLLTKPLNRLASYELTLTRMTDATNPSDSDFRILASAASQMNETNKFIRNSLAKAQNVSSVLKALRRLDSDGKAESNFLADGTHELLKEVSVEILKRQGFKKKMPGILYAFNDTLLITSSHKSDHHRVKRLFVIEFCRVEQIEGLTISACATAPDDGPDIVKSKIKISFINANDHKDWMPLLKRLKDSSKKSMVFGIPISILVEREASSLFEQKVKHVPIIIVRLFNFLFEHGIDTIGVFRVPGSAAKENEIRNLINQRGSEAELTKDMISPHDAAGLIKLYFRVLPEALCGEFFESFVATLRLGSENETVDALTAIVKKFSPIVKATLRYTCLSMHRFASNSEINKMDFSNIAMCVGPDLMRPAVDSLELALQIPKINEVLLKLIIYHEIIFKE